FPDHELPAPRARHCPRRQADGCALLHHELQLHTGPCPGEGRAQLVRPPRQALTKARARGKVGELSGVGFLQWRGESRRGRGRFALFTGMGGEAWKEAAEEFSARTGVKIACFVIGPGREVLDLYDWARLREVAESGCVLVRPDAHVGWRQQVVADDCITELARVMNRIL